MAHPAVEAVQADFIAEIQKNGIMHTFEWIDGWYNRLAKAELKAELDRLGEYASDPEAVRLVYEQRLGDLGQRAFNHSNLMGPTMMKQAQTEAVARAYREVSRRDQDARWDAVRARHSAATEAAPKE